MLTLNITRQNRTRLQTGDVVVLHARADVENGPHADDLLDHTLRLATVLDVRYHPANPEFLTDIDIREHDVDDAVTLDEEGVASLSFFSGRVGRSLGEIHRLVLTGLDDPRATGTDTVALICDACGRNVTTQQPITDHAGRDLCRYCAKDAHTIDDDVATDDVARFAVETPDDGYSDRDIAIMETAQREQAVEIAVAKTIHAETCLRTVETTHARGHASIDRVRDARHALADSLTAQATAIDALIQDRTGDQADAMHTTVGLLRARAVEIRVLTSPHNHDALVRLALVKRLLSNVPMTMNVMHALSLIDAELPPSGDVARGLAFADAIDAMNRLTADPTTV